MPCQCSLRRDGRRLHVTNLTDHDDVRVLSKQAAKGRCEGQVDAFMNLDLGDAFQAVFHRILDRGYIQSLQVHLLERCVQRRRLSRSSRSRDKQDAVWPVDLVPPCVEDRRSESKPIERDIDRSIVEESHDGLLPVRSRHGTDPEVQWSLQDGCLDSTILREPAFGDIERRHDLQA